MGSGVAVITDSTADLPADLATELGVQVVPMTVAFGDEEYVSGRELTDQKFYARLAASDELPVTSQPAPAWFEEAYAAAAAGGASAAVSIHVSSRLSGTCDVARQVAASAPLPVEVIDSRQVSGGLALAVLAAQRAAARGAAIQQVAAAVWAVASATHEFFVVDTLEYLRRGGRLRGVEAAVGTVLRVKPILTVRDGEVVLLERARTWTRASSRLVAVVVEAAGGQPVDVFVTHAAAPERAAEVTERVRDAVTVRDAHTALVGPVVGTHCGPGAVGVAVAPAGGR